MYYLPEGFSYSDNMKMRIIGEFLRYYYKNYFQDKKFEEALEYIRKYDEDNIIELIYKKGYSTEEVSKIIYKDESSIKKLRRKLLVEMYNMVYEET